MIHRLFRRTTPFDFARGVPAPGRYPPDNLGPIQGAEAIRNAPIEVGYGFAANGRQIFRQVGDEGNIWRFRPGDLHAIVNGMFVHNHPPYAGFAANDPRRRAGSFSAADLVFMYDVNLAELVAVTEERTYVAQRPSSGFFLDPGQIIEEYRRLTRRIVDTRRHLRRTGQMTDEEEAAQGTLADEVMEELGLFYDYRWEQVT